MKKLIELFKAPYYKEFEPIRSGQERRREKRKQRSKKL